MARKLVTLTKRTLDLIDKKICSYLKISQQHTKPMKVNFDGQDVFVTSVESYKRHIYSVKLPEFCTNLTSINDRKKLGIAVGKSLANNLTISYETPEVTRTR